MEYLDMAPFFENRRGIMMKTLVVYHNSGEVFFRMTKIPVLDPSYRLNRKIYQTEGKEFAISHSWIQRDHGLFFNLLSSLIPRGFISIQPKKDTTSTGAVIQIESIKDDKKVVDPYIVHNRIACNYIVDFFHNQRIPRLPMKTSFMMYVSPYRLCLDRY